MHVHAIVLVFVREEGSVLWPPNTGTFTRVPEPTREMGMMRPRGLILVPWEMLTHHGNYSKLPRKRLDQFPRYVWNHPSTPFDRDTDPVILHAPIVSNSSFLEFLSQGTVECTPFLNPVANKASYMARAASDIPYASSLAKVCVPAATIWTDEGLPSSLEELPIDVDTHKWLSAPFRRNCVDDCDVWMERIVEIKNSDACKPYTQLIMGVHGCNPTSCGFLHGLLPSASRETWVDDMQHWVERWTGCGWRLEYAHEIRHERVRDVTVMIVCGSPMPLRWESSMPREMASMVALLKVIVLAEDGCLLADLGCGTRDSGEASAEDPSQKGLLAHDSSEWVVETGHPYLVDVWTVGARERILRRSFATAVQRERFLLSLPPSVSREWILM